MEEFGCADVVVLLPSDSLRTQLESLCKDSSGYRVRFCRAEDARGLHRAISESQAALIDATNHPTKAIDVLALAVSRLGLGAAAVYSAKATEDFESRVREYGGWMVLGPLSPADWEDLLESLARVAIKANRDKPAFQQQPRRSLKADYQVRGIVDGRTPVVGLRRPRTSARQP